MKMESLARKLSREEAGQGLVDYIFILMLVAVVAIAGLEVLPDGIVNAFCSTQNGLN